MKIIILITKMSQFVSLYACVVHVCVCVCVCIAYYYRKHQGWYGAQKHMKVATEAQHTNDGHDDGEDEVMITNRATWCTQFHLWSSRLLLNNHYMGTRLLEWRGEERR